MDKTKNQPDLETRTREFLSALLIVQRVPPAGIPAFICPRCGLPKMRPNYIENCLSRHETIYICTDCGADEASRDWNGSPLPLVEWDIATQLDPHHEWTVMDIDVQDLMIADVDEYSDGSTVEAYIGCWFDVESKFDLKLDSDDDNINLYAYYTPATQKLAMQYILCCSKGPDRGPFSYKPTEKESDLVISLMEMACQKEHGCSMEELVATEKAKE